MAGMDAMLASPMMMESHWTWPKHWALPTITGVEDLVGTVLGHGAGDDPALGVVAVELDDHVALGLLIAVGQQALGDHRLSCRLAADDLRLALGGVDAADLGGLHLHGGVLAPGRPRSWGS